MVLNTDLQVRCYIHALRLHHFPSFFQAESVLNELFAFFFFFFCTFPGARICGN